MNASSYMILERTISKAFENVRASKNLNLVYLNNAKSGCTTVKEWLETASGGRIKELKKDYHNEENVSFVHSLKKVDWIEDATVFSVVRHPLDRLVSGYENKILNPNKTNNVRMGFCRRYGLDHEAEISFPTFLESIASDPFPHELNPHWRPQHANLVFPFIVPNYICRLENLADDFSNFLQSIGKSHLGIPGHLHKRRSSGPEKMMRLRKYFADKEIMSLACDIYKIDFRAFSYRPELDDNLLPDFSPKYSSHKHPRAARLAKIIRGNQNKAAQTLVDDLRCVLRDEVFLTNSNPKTEITDPHALRTDNTKLQIAGIGLDRFAASSDKIDLDMTSAEENLLTSLYESALGCTNKLQHENEKLQRENEELQRENKQLIREKEHAYRYPWKHLGSAWRSRFKNED